MEIIVFPTKRSSSSSFLARFIILLIPLIMTVSAAFVPASTGTPKDESVETLAPWSKRVSTATTVPG